MWGPAPTPPRFIALVSAGDENLRHITPSASNPTEANCSLSMQKGDARMVSPLANPLRRSCRSSPLHYPPVAVKHMQYIVSYGPVQVLSRQKFESWPVFPDFCSGFSVSALVNRNPELSNTIPACLHVLSDCLFLFRNQSISVKNLSLTFGPV